MGRSVPPLVDTTWVSEHIDDPAVRIIDARPTPEYLARHIKNAVSASFSASDSLSHGVNISYGGGCDLFTDPQATTPWQDGPKEMLEAVLGRLGISNDTTVVVIGAGRGFYATRFFWTLDYCGHKNVCILNGGMPKWLAEGHQVTKRVPRVASVRYHIEAFDTEKIVHTEFILENLMNPEVVLAECLTSDWYSGEYLAYSRRGHLPGAKSLPFPYHFAEDGSWKQASELLPMYRNSGVTSDKQVITYCGGNPGSTVCYFALRYILGYPRVSVFSEALVGWCQDPRNLPLDTYGVPALLRDAEWVNWWSAGRIQRLINNPRARVIDARSREEYEKGHIPFSLNIPAAEMQSRGMAPPRGKLASILGRKGITRWNDVVIYDDDDGHLAAWLFWVLEYYGHDRVSILNGGFREWQSKGFEVTRDIPIIRRPKSIYTFDVAIPPGRFTAEPQPHRLASREWVRRNLNHPDKLFIHASPGGIPIPGTANVEWRANVTGDGSFRSAAELTNIYEATGATKIREIVCVSRSGADAAHTYFTLRLLGYPRVRLGFLGE